MPRLSALPRRNTPTPRRSVWPLRNNSAWPLRNNSAWPLRNNSAWPLRNSAWLLRRSNMRLRVPQHRAAAVAAVRSKMTTGTRV
jgi:hypothetical protein